MAALRGAADDATQNAWIRAERVRDEAAKVLGGAPKVAELLADLQRARTEIIAKGIALMWLADRGALDLDNISDSTSAQSVFSPAKSALVALEMAPFAWSESQSMTTTDRMRIIAPWVAALAALQDDATVELPR